MLFVVGRTSLVSNHAIHETQIPLPELRFQPYNRVSLEAWSCTGFVIQHRHHHPHPHHQANSIAQSKSIVRNGYANTHVKRLSIHGGPSSLLI